LYNWLAPQTMSFEREPKFQAPPSKMLGSSSTALVFTHEPCKYWQTSSKLDGAKNNQWDLHEMKQNRKCSTPPERLAWTSAVQQPSQSNLCIRSSSPSASSIRHCEHSVETKRKRHRGREAITVQRCCSEIDHRREELRPNRLIRSTLRQTDSRLRFNTGGHQPFWNREILLVYWLMRRAASLVHTSEIKILLNLPRIILV